MYTINELTKIINPEKMIKIFYDLETTGVNSLKHSIHQIAGLVEVDGAVVEKFDLKTRPHPKAEITPEAMHICNVTEEQILNYPEMGKVYRKFCRMLGKYIDKFDSKKKAWLVGFNNRYFDDVFLRAWFIHNGDQYINSWFWGDTLDALVLASQYLLDRREGMSSFKQKRVATELGIDVDKTKLHDAEYDVYLTRQIYRIVTGLEVEI